MKNSGLFTVSALMSPAAIKLNLQSASREAVLEELVDLIPAISRKPDARQTLLRALHDREQLYSTGIGDGIALPHARNALVGLVHDPVIVFGRSNEGIPYGSIDGAPAKLFFLLVAPSVTQHLAALARLSRLLRDPALRRDLLAVNDAKRALSLIRAAEDKL